MISTLAVIRGGGNLKSDTVSSIHFTMSEHDHIGRDSFKGIVYSTIRILSLFASIIIPHV